MRAIIWTMLKSVVLGLTPYGDPVRRWRARRTAKAVIVTQTWPQQDADITGRHVAELALLRIMHLQTECRRAKRHGMPEAAMALSRIAIEVCLFGLYCVYHEDAMEKIRSHNVKALRGLLNLLVSTEVLSESFLNDSLVLLGAAKDLKVYEMAAYIDSKWGTSDARGLYRAYYAPLSTLFVHANGLSLMRYVRWNGKLSTKPKFPWVKRSAMHTVDASMALLAIALAEETSPARTFLRRYGEAHTKRLLTPLIVMASKGSRSSWNLREARPAMRAILDMHRYARSQQAIADSREARIERIGQGFDTAFRIFRSEDLPDGVIELFRDYLVGRVVDSIVEQAARNADGGGRPQQRQ